jgi:hypothetical protein
MWIYSGQTCGEILPVHDYRDGGEYWYGSFPGLVLFRLVALPLQPGVVGQCMPVWYGVLSPLAVCHWRESVVSRFFGCNRRPAIPGVQDPDSRPRAFRGAGDRSRSLDGRQNRYLYVTAGTAAGFGGEAMELKPPWS